MTTVVDIETYSDSDFSLVQAVLVHTGTNPLHMHVRKTADDNTVWLDISTANAMLTASDTAPGADVTLKIPQASLLNLPAGDYVHSCIMSSQGGMVRTEIWRGSLTHHAGPTRWAAGTP